MIDKVFGTGGIGTGLFFKLHNNRPITREESRTGFLTDYKDYCKAHIILHYIAVLTKGVAVYAVGMVGRDEQGESLMREMRDAGIDTRFVETTDRARTLFSVCYQYPDGTGGNITSSNSACALVTPARIALCADEIDNSSLVLSVPEVPLDSRIRLLEIGKERKAFTVSSFLAEEARDFEEAGGFLLSDLIAVNRSEAESVGGSIEAAADKISRINPGAKLIITAGSDGSYFYENGTLSHIPCIPAEVVSTAGAGDAFLGGTVAGFINGKNLRQAAEYGAVAARFAVMSEHTIARSVTAENIENDIRGMNHGI